MISEPGGAPGTRASEIYGGTPDGQSTPELNTTLQVVLGEVEGGAHGIDLACSGFLVTPEWAMTAGHCVTTSEGLRPASSVRFGPDGRDPVEEIQVTETHIPPGAPLYSWGMSDIALVRLERRVPSSLAVAVRPRLDAPSPGSYSALARGYGANAPACPDLEPLSGGDVRREAWVDAVIASGAMPTAISSSHYGMKGDSGGPLLLEGVPIGVDSAGWCAAPEGKRSVWAATYDPRNAEWIRGMLELPDGRWLGEDEVEPGDWRDPDGDLLITDNCPDDYNPDQNDDDADGAGDVCDTCNTHTDSVRRNSNHEIELLYYDGPPPLGYGLGDARPVTRADYEGPDADGDGIADYLEQRALHYQDDDCEHAALVPMSLGLEEYPSLRPPGCARCSVGATTRIEHALTHASPGAVIKSGTYGFRFCKCSQPDLSTPRARIQCRNECPFFAAEYANTAGVWMPITLAESSTGPGELGREFGRSFAQPWHGLTHRISWRVDLDRDTWETGITDPAVARTHGILWAHVREDNLQAVLQAPPDPAYPVAFRTRASTYVDGSVAMEMAPSFLPFPHLPPTLLAGCAVCGNGTRPVFAGFDDLRGAVVAISGAGGRALTSLVSPGALEVLRAVVAAPSRVVYASEPAALLSRHRTEWSAVTLDDAGGLGGYLRFTGARLEGAVAGGEYRATAPAPANAPPPVRGGAFVGAATKGEVLRVGGLEGRRRTRYLWSLDTTGTGEWSRTRVVGPRPGRVLAATYRYHDDALYVVDEAAYGSVVRMLRVRRTGLSEELGRWPRAGRAELGLTVSDRDELVLSFSGRVVRAHLVVVLEVDRDRRVRPTRLHAGTGKLLRPAYLSDRWLGLVVARHGAWAVEDVSRDWLVPIGGFGACAGWW